MFEKLAENLASREATSLTHNQTLIVQYNSPVANRTIPNSEASSHTIPSHPSPCNAMQFSSKMEGYQ